ncbi:MAG TPA: Gldg family protein, partial [Pirellulales bacterium]|nr:Gldg family protein [Pirellulales bacterium]
LGGRDGHSLVGHYLVRSLALAVLIVAAISFFHDHDFARVDVSSERLSSLSPETVKLIQNLDAKRPVRVDAYVSTADEVPESYITTRLNLLNALKEFESIGGNKLSINVHDVNRFSDDVGRAERQFGIKPETVESHNRGLRDPDAKVMLGLAFTCGTDPAVIVPFVGKSLPVEYEIARSIATVSQTKRKQVGVLTTDVRLFGTPDMMTGASQNQMLIDELKKQYDVVQVDPAKPITERYDVLLAAQPSSLSPEAMHNFIEAVKRGQPTAIFEDPFPVFFNGVPGTNQPKQPPGGMMGMQQPPAPKGNIQPLWDLLEVDFNGGNVICQDYFPSPKWASLIRSTQFGNVEWVFASPGEGNPDAFNPNEPITSGLSMVLFPFAGSIQHRNKAERTKFTPLVATGDKTGIVDQTKILMPSNPFMMSGPQINPNLLNQVKPQNLRYQLAAKLTGTADMTPPLNPKMSDKDFQDAASPATVPTAAPRNGAGAAPANADEKASDEKKADEKKTDEKTANGDKAASEKAAASKEAATDNQATPNKEPAPKAGSDQGSEKAGGEKAGSDKGGEKAGSEKAGSEKEKTPDHGVTDKTASGKSKSGAAAPDKEASKPPVSTDLNVVVVADVDVLASAFFGLRLRGEEFMDDVKPDADNVIFVLNTIDELAAETRFLDIRKRRKVYRTLQKIDTLVSDSEQQLAKKREEDLNKVEDAVKQYNKAMRAKVEELQKQSNVSDRELNDQIRQYEKVEQDRIAVKLEKAKKESEQKLDEIRKSQANDIRRVQMGYKFWSIILPPLLPLCLAAIVFFRRRSEEREGVSRARLK